ncbi:MAG: membrane protein insertase YidC [Saprospirales bacterium]|nr:MAG: membrane protein insertase YidC [Saprospirales bacterium]
MDRNTAIGIVLLFILFVIWVFINSPTQEEIEARKLERERQEAQRTEQPTEMDTASQLEADTVTEDFIAEPSTIDTAQLKSERMSQFRSLYGPFANAAMGVQEEEIILENEHLRIVFSNLGGRIKEVWVKKHLRSFLSEDMEEMRDSLFLMDHPGDRFEYFLQLRQNNMTVSTGELYFDHQLQNNTLVFRLNAENGGYFEQRYTIHEGSYALDYQLNFVNLQNILANEPAPVSLNWVNYLNKLEQNTGYERYFSTVYFKEDSRRSSYCSCRRSDTENKANTPLKWISHANQFFNSSLVAKETFHGGFLETVMLDESAEELKILRSRLDIPITMGNTSSFDMTFYIGPNDFERLQLIGHDLTDIVPFGWSIFGTINRWVVRPMFSTLMNWTNSPALVIILLTLIVKMALYPLTYKMLYSQAKMSALKPHMEKLREKFKGDQQKMQMETMKIYREFGVNPLGGCMPMVLQMPIWFALYRFFPASIEFRQESFLWASDLSSYDAIVYLGFTIPFYGAHISLFTLLWAGTTVLYTHYNTKHMDMNAVNPMMKNIQYFMPIMFLFFFNSFASGLTAYLFVSNLVNIAQIVVTKNFIFDEEKIKAQLELNKKKPKKKGGFQARLEEVLKEQQRIAEERKKKSKK